MTSDRLFVYGTLMRGFDHPMARLLAGHADFLGDATCRGRLVLVTSSAANNQVHPDCARSKAWIEGFSSTHSTMAFAGGAT
ncbi:gamma-glutamylcyclotransferase (GGCT)/AIG2-like uncharacterized protein YtfP [Bradyrhizobium barranii subsp. barranii]